MTDIPRRSCGGARVIRTECSFSSSSTVVPELDVTTNQPTENAYQRDGKRLVQQIARRMEDEQNSVLQRDNPRGLNDEPVPYSSGPRMREPSSTAESNAYISNAERWGLGLSQILEFGATNISRKLAETSFDKFSRLPFAEFVRKAGGDQSDIIYDYIWSYCVLAEKLYFDFAKASNHLNKLLQVKESLEEEDADPFIRATVEYAWTKIVYLNLSKLQDKAWDYLPTKLGDILNRLVIHPLQQVTDRPYSDVKIQQDLKIVETRFHRNLRPLNVDWRSPLQVSTQFADQMHCSDSWCLAEALTRKDKIIFEAYIAVYFQKEDIQAQSILSTRWNRLMVDVSDCLTADIGLEAKIEDLAHNLYRLRNFYSLAAIIHGLRQSYLRIESLEMYDQLFNPARNYHTYRECMGTGSALHFIQPIFVALKHGQKEYAAIALEASAEDTHFNISCHPESGSGDSGQLEDTTSMGNSFLNFFSVCFRF